MMFSFFHYNGVSVSHIFIAGIVIGPVRNNRVSKNDVQVSRNLLKLQSRTGWFFISGNKFVQVKKA